MPDSRLPQRWLNNPIMRELTDTDWRVYTWGLMFCNDQLTDGNIPASALGLLHPQGLQPESYQRLVDAGLWTSKGNGAYLSLDWEVTQTTAEKFHTQRESARNRKRNERARKAPTNVTQPVTRDVQGEDKARQGIGEARVTELLTTANPTTGEVTDWEVRAIPVPDLEDGETF